VTTQLSPEVFLARLAHYARDWRDSRLPPELLSQNVYGFEFHRESATRFRLVPQGLRTGGTWVMVECYGDLKPLPSEPGAWLVVVEANPPRNMWLALAVLLLGIAVLAAIIAEPSARLRALLTVTPVAGALLGIASYFNIRVQARQIWPGVQAMVRRLAA
jgi:hypothetical protein